MGFIIANQLNKTYETGDSAVSAILEVSFKIEAGEFIAVMGESGAGKSTLLSIMGAMNTPTSGSYIVDDIDVYNLNQDRRADFRREFLGFIFQSFHLIPYLSVIENVMLPLTTARLRPAKKRDRAINALKSVSLESKAFRLPSQISGGEKERVAIARAIVNEPPILLADEPTGNLDSGNSHGVMRLLRQLNDQGTTVIMVTHSADCANYARRLLKLSDGRFVESEKHENFSGIRSIKAA